MQTTMDDIARECGISKMTVSRVLSSRAGVSAHTRDRVLASAKRLNYETNALARNLSLNRSAFVGVATPFEGLLGSFYFAQLMLGFQSALAGSEWDFALFDALSDAFDDGSKLARLYRQRKVDGLLVIAPHMHDRFLETLSSIRVPMVIIGEPITNQSICSVSCRDQHGIFLSCDHLYALGHRDIAFVGGPANLTSARRRERAFRDFSKRRGLRLPPGFIHPGDYTVRSGHVAGDVLLRMKARPTAIIAANDLVAFGVSESARELGLRIPEDLSVVGFDDLPAAGERSFGLTTVHQPVFEMGQCGAQLLVDALQGETLPRGQKSFEVSLVVRQSSGPCPPKRKRARKI